jgi:hypothetical protein
MNCIALDCLLKSCNKFIIKLMYKHALRTLNLKLNQCQYYTKYKWKSPPVAKITMFVILFHNHIRERHSQINDRAQSWNAYHIKYWGQERQCGFPITWLNQQHRSQLNQYHFMNRALPGTASTIWRLFAASSQNWRNLPVWRREQY